jgi:sugar phosphate isomerase/epimerase
MKTSIATVSLSGDLSEKLEAISAAGFNGIEIFEQDFIAYDRTPREVSAMVRDHGLEINLLQPFRDFEGLSESCRTRAFARAERKFDVMQELGADLILVCSSVHPEAIGGIDRAAQDLRELGERAARRGLRVGYEALAWGRYVNDHREPTIPMSGSFSTASTPSPARSHRTRSAAFQVTRSSSSSSPTRRPSRWTSSIGHVTFVTCLERETSM